MGGILIALLKNKFNLRVQETRFCHAVEQKVNSDQHGKAGQ